MSSQICFVQFRMDDDDQFHSIDRWKDRPIDSVHWIETFKHFCVPKITQKLYWKHTPAIGLARNSPPTLPLPWSLLDWNFEPIRRFFNTHFEAVLAGQPYCFVSFCIVLYFWCAMCVRTKKNSTELAATSPADDDDRHGWRLVLQPKHWTKQKLSHVFCERKTEPKNQSNVQEPKTTHFTIFFFCFWPIFRLLLELHFKIRKKKTTKSNKNMRTTFGGKMSS